MPSCQPFQAPTLNLWRNSGGAFEPPLKAFRKVVQGGPHLVGVPAPAEPALLRNLRQRMHEAGSSKEGAAVHNQVSTGSRPEIVTAKHALREGRVPPMSVRGQARHCPTIIAAGGPTGPRPAKYG